MRKSVSAFAAHPLRVVALASFAAAIGFALPAIHAVAASATKVDVDIAKFLFAKKEITVAPGTTVVWTNRDEAPHTVAAADKSFSSKGLDTNDTFEHTFPKEGDFDYICTVHPFMTGVVHVHK
ncbi:MAG TPA: cupredoxin family copper-binding protein [Casimicrobiaceae bacterium]|nr:cupredoxin family copper-binding protein [Casimicrobiaceae bacterium]